MGMNGVLQRDIVRPAARARALSPGEDEDDRLIERISRDRDREAFARLFLRFAPKLKAYLMKAGADAATAEDFAQDAMLTVWRKADLFDPRKARASTWIFTIARNRRLDALRRESRPLSAPEIDLTSVDPERPDDLLQERQEAERIRQALDSLSPDQIEVIRMAYFQEQPHSEVAHVLQLPLGTVKSRIRAAMTSLRLRLDGPTNESRK